MRPLFFQPHAVLLAALLLLPPAAPGRATASSPAPPPIALEVDDPAIEQRLAALFAEIEGLSGVRVTSRAGVVRLEGQIAQGSDEAQAVRIAERTAGVVAVESRLARKPGLDSEVAPAFARLQRDARTLWRAVPLLLVAALVALAVILAGRWLSRRRRLWQRLGANGFIAEFLAASVRIIFLLAGLVIFFQMLGATALMGAVLGGAGVLGIALGFAIRDTVDNYVSSLMLSLRQPFAASDHVRIGELGEGRVIRLTPRATILMTLDGNQLRIPNATVFKSVILNYSRNPERRFEFDLALDPGTDSEAARTLARDAVVALPFVLAEPKPFVILADMTASSLILRVHGWIDQRETDFPRGRSQAIVKAVAELKAAGYRLPQTAMHVTLGRERTAHDEGQGSPGRPLPATDAGVGADDDIVRLVAQERASDGDDLLDAARRRD